MPIPLKQIKQFQKKIFRFYHEYGRKLPWRETIDPYNILISEIMLQQTQVDRVIPYYSNWLKRWSTITKLAQAKRTDVLKGWMGLGYNNRAIYLHNTAKKIVKEYQGDIIKAIKQYRQLPGIGPYTSEAVQIFSKNEHLATVDTNIRRILIYEFSLKENIADRDLRLVAEQCLPKGKSRDWHNALMDYGATFLTSQKTGIRPKTVQSKFEGSDRQIRARILRYMLKEAKREGYSFSLLAQAAKVEDRERLERIIKKMVSGSLLKHSRKRYFLDA